MLSDHVVPVIKISRLCWSLIAVALLTIAGAAVLLMFGIPDTFRTVLSGEASIVSLVAGLLIAWLASVCWMEHRTQRLKGTIDILNQLLEHAPLGIQLKDADLRYVWFNKIHTANHGQWHVSLKDLIGKTVQEAGFTPELERTITDHDLATLRAAKQLEPREQVRESPDGSPALVLLVTKVPIIQNGAVRYIATMAADTSTWRDVQLKKEEQRRLLEAVMEAAPITIQVIDRDMRFRWVNQCYRDYFDIGDAPVIGKSVNDIERSRHLVSDVISTNERILNGSVASLRMEQYLPARDGRPEVYLSVTKVPVKDSDGNIVQVLTMGTDITELKQAQGRADLVTGLVEAILRHAPIALQVKDTDLRFQWANQHFADTLGFAAEELIGHTLMNFDLPHDAVALTNERDRMVLATGKPIEFDERWIKGGHHKYFRVIKAALIGKDGRPTHVITTGADITEHVRLRAEAEAARNLLQLVVESVPVALALKGADQRFLLANAAFGQFWSVSPTTILGKLESDVFANRPSMAAAPEEWLAADESEPPSIIQHMTQGDGTTRTLSVRRIAVRDETGTVTGSLIVGADVTDLYNTTKELRSLADSLEVRVADRTRALTEATNLASAVIRNTPIPIVVFDTTGRISVANDAALRLAQVDDTAGLDVLLTRQAADTVQAFRDLIACARHGRPRPPQEITFVTNDGEAATLLMSGAPLSAETSPDSGVVSSWINLTQERQANAEMRLWFQAFQQAGVGLALTQGAREHAVIVGANQIAERMMRLPPRALIGKSPASIYFKEDIPRVLAAVRMADEGEHAAFESRVLRMDGTTFHAALTIDRVNLPDRAEPIRVCTLTDISDRKRVEAERDRWASAIEFAAFGIAIVDADTHQHLAANSAYADIHRRTVAETIGSPESTCFPAESLSMYNALIRDAAASGHAETNCPRLRSDGTTFPAWTAITSVHRPDVNLRYRIATVIDMTQYSRVEEQLRQAQKMEAIGNLTGGMAHDFNNLLGIIIGNLELAQTQSRDGGELQEYLAYATDAALSGAELIRRLLAFARRQPLRPERISLNQTVTNVARLLERLLGTDVRISMNLTADIWPVITDASQVEACLLNLATNARDAMPQGGSLTISTVNLRIDDDTSAQAHGVAPADYVVIEVSDTGAGIAPDILTEIFEPFFTTKTAGHGTGLGLSMVYGFMKQSGGHVGVTSQLGRGSTFRLYLPRSAPSTEDSPNDAAAVTDASNGEVILVVEDNEQLARVVKRQLVDLGYRVLQAANADEALTVLTSAQIDLMLTDIVMPGTMDGFALANLVQQRWPGIHIVLTSGFPKELPSNTQDFGNQLHVLPKPYRRAQLAQLIREVLASGRS